MSTQLERFRATCAHQRLDQFMVKAGFTQALLEKLVKHYGTKDLSNVFACPNDQFGNFGSKRWAAGEPDFSRYFEGEKFKEGFTIDTNGVGHEPGSMYHFTHYVSPLRHATAFDEIERFPIDSCPPGFEPENFAERVRQKHAEGKIAGFHVVHMYEDAWQMRGYQEFLMDMVLQPEWAESILDRLAAANLLKAESAARAGCDVLITGDDVANQNTLMFSKDMWRRFIKARWAKVYAAARKIKPDIEIWYHSDGNIIDIIPELIEIGVTILNPFQPECMDFEWANKTYGDRLVFDGTIGTQTTMPWGKPEEVKALVRSRIKTVGTKGNLIISPTHVLEPEVPIENIRALFEAVKEYS